MLRIDDTVLLQDWELSESFARASGPGGQHVNKVSTAVELRFDAARSPSLTPAVKQRLKRLAGRRWTQDGALILRVEDTRSQVRNREIARERLVALIAEALVAPKARIPTRPTRASERRRIATKVRRGAVKATRAPVDESTD